MYENILEAATRESKCTHRTAVITSRTLDKVSCNQVFLKCENFQSTGSFKFRGAYNAVSLLSEEQKKNGIITYSSGNHAQAVALTGKSLNIKTTVVIPNNIAKIKLEACKSYNAEIVMYDPLTDDRQALTEEFASKNGCFIVPPFNHKDVIAGQGTVAKELLDEVFTLDYLLVPCGGGGLLSGCAAYAKTKFPKCKVIGVEPEMANDAYQSFKSGQIVTRKNPQTVADGLRTPALSEMTFGFIRQFVDDIVTVSEDEIIGAMYYLWTRQKIVVEPSGAVPLAAALFRKIPDMVDKRVGVILSGGNVDVIEAAELFKKTSFAEFY
jgi:threonine dehydratase